MTIRKQVVEAITNSENAVLPEREIFNEVSVDSRRVKAALEGLTQEQVLERRSLLRDNYYTVSSDAKVEQAIHGTSAAELSEQAIRDSTVMGNSQEGHQSDDFDQFMRELF